MIKIILNLLDTEEIVCGSRAAAHLVHHPEKEEALMVYGESDDPPTFWVRRNKQSISVWEQPRKLMIIKD